MQKKDARTNRRSFLKSSLLLGGLVITQHEPRAQHAPESKEEFSFLAGPYLQTTFANSMTILWVTNREASSWVEYGTSETKLDQKAYGTSELGLKPAGRINRITLERLQPGKTYYYQIVSKELVEFQPYKVTYGPEKRADIEQFTVSDPTKQTVSFLMLNDIHDRPNSIGHLLGLDQEADRDFVFFNGDIFDYQTDEQQLIEHMLTPVTQLFAKHKPFLFVRGNHETRGKFARDIADYFQHIGNSAFTLGPARFVIIDSGEDKEDDHPVYAGIVDFDSYRREQAKWLAEEIQGEAFRRAAFRVVLMHIPPRYSGDAHGATHCTELFEPLFNQGKVDVVLSGHTHRYKIHPPAAGLNNYPIVIGGGPRDGQRTLTRVEMTNQQLNVQLLNDAGEEVGQYTVNRKK
ncbi:metallophosphoesterase [Sphingobacterium suaedae]|uniref:Metallophosphoesterase n=1 Tax=Sphingobacterium suaedae TaxID=1686402 RepID=A0ABW5KLG6_9SPHI